MAPKHWVANASPLILLGKAHRLYLLPALADRIAVPRSVVAEVNAKPGGKATLEGFFTDPACLVVDTEEVPAEILRWDLGAGETQVIAAALRHGADRAVIDDLEARRCAKAMELPIIGTLGLVGRAKAMGLIDEATPLIQRLRETGLYVSDKLVRQLLHNIGE